jgi:MFS family permease
MGVAGMGVAAAMIYPSTLALLSSTFTDRKQEAAAIGIWSGVSGLAVGLGPLAGGLLLEHYWWGLDLHGEHPRGGCGPDRGIQSGARIS